MQSIIMLTKVLISFLPPGLIHGTADLKIIHAQLLEDILHCQLVSDKVCHVFKPAINNMPPLDGIAQVLNLRLFIRFLNAIQQIILQLLLIVFYQNESVFRVVTCKLFDASSELACLVVMCSLSYILTISWLPCNT